MANKEILEEPVPTLGSLTPGAVYRRSDLHHRFGGNQMKGIVPSSREGVVLLFHTEEKNQQFYEDGWGPDGFYSYSGEGRHGDMEWTANNQAIRDHVRDGRDLLLFERTQRRRGLWRYYGIMECHGFEYRQAPDFKNKLRRAIIFKLVAENDARESVAQAIPLSNLRDRAYVTLQPQENPTLQTILERRKRSQDVKVYVLSRAGEFCEACSTNAPFRRVDGSPFLEVHHIDKISDGGMDLPDRVAAICPNCHRRCHFGNDRVEYNRILRQKIVTIERSLDEQI